jgi:hypothetical protein
MTTVNRGSHNKYTYKGPLFHRYPTGEVISLDNAKLANG